MVQITPEEVIRRRQLEQRGGTVKPVVEKKPGIHRAKGGKETAKEDHATFQNRATL